MNGRKTLTLQILRLLGNYLFQVSASTNGSYNWMGNKTKEEINVLTREMGMLAISLLKLSEIVLEVSMLYFIYVSVLFPPPQKCKPYIHLSQVSVLSLTH